MLTCYHEAGHAVIAWLGGATVTEISVDGGYGYTLIAGITHLAPALRVKIGLAGWTAEHRYRYGSHSACEVEQALAWAERDDSDGRLVAGGLGDLGGDKWATGWRLLDEVNSELQAVWPVVVRIAGSLQRYKLLEKGHEDMQPLRKSPPVGGRPLTAYELRTRAATAEQAGNEVLAAMLRASVARSESRQLKTMVASSKIEHATKA